jgi:hypothetical protein
MERSAGIFTTFKIEVVFAQGLTLRLYGSCRTIEKVKIKMEINNTKFLIFNFDL